LQIDFEDFPRIASRVLLARADGARNLRCDLDRLGLSGADVWGGLHRLAGPAAVACAADGGASDPQAHLRLSDEALCDRWVENPYFQYFCSEEFFQHALVFDRSSLTRWRQRMGQASSRRCCRRAWRWRRRDETLHRPEARRLLAWLMLLLVRILIALRLPAQLKSL
jgi:Transposase domain (DUF772)